MSGMISHDPGRRSFLLTAAPVCALAFLGSQSALAIAQSKAKQSGDEVIHKFDGDLGRKLTVRQYFNALYKNYIDLTKAIEKEWGKERTIAFLKNMTTERMKEYGALQASKAEKNDFETYVSQFRSGYENLLTKEVVEDTENAFELRVTECIWADTFRRADAADIGFCSVCWGDYTWPTAFNERITMVRDKTLMQGHDFCNHRYLWKA